MTRPRTNLAFPMFVSAILMATGCGDKGPKIYHVTGTATHAGKPLPNLIVSFSPEVGRPSGGFTDADGKYELIYDPERKGAQVGKHRVYVEFRAADPGQEHLERTGQSKATDVRGAVLAKYSEEASQLTVQVESDNQVIDLKLD